VARSLLRVALCACLVQLPAAFRAGPVRSSPQPHGAARSSGVRMMPAPQVLAKKAKVVEEVKATLEDTTLMFCVRSAGLKVNELNALRQKLPESVTMRCVKNTLVKRAVEDFPQFQGGDDLLHYSNYWFFVPEDQMRPAVDTWNDFIDETKKEDNAILGGLFEGQVLDPAGVVAVTKLPTKQELMGQTATMLKMLPTKLARSLNEAGAQRLAKVTKQAAGQKLVQAVKAVEASGKLE